MRQREQERGRMGTAERKKKGKWVHERKKRGRVTRQKKGFMTNQPQILFPYCTSGGGV